MKKRLLRVVTYFLIFIMTVTNLPMAFAAPAEYGTLQITQTNPHFAGLEAPLQITQTAPLYFSDGESTQEYYTDPADAAAVIRDAMEAREESFTVGYSVSEKVPEGEEERKAWFNSIAFDLLREKAFEETENATEGDSLRFSWRGVSLSIKYVSYPERTDISLTYNYTYFANAAQEAELTAAVDELVEEFAFTAQTTEREKIDAIYDWLCANVDYDHDHPDDYNLKFSAYAAMVHKTAVCEGYAVLFYRLAEEVGLDARVITGKATHSGENHAWNIVRLDDSYYYLDATWDANAEPQDYAYYLRGASDFYGHTIDAQYETAVFRARYPLAIEGASDSNGIELTLGDWNVLIVGRSQAIILEYLGNDANVTVPASFDLDDYPVGWTGVVPVDAIAGYAFADGANVNTTIESITVSEGIHSLGSFAISYCTNLKELHLPSTLQIKSYGFTSGTEIPISCRNMETVTVAEGNPYLKLENGVLYTADGATALYCPPKNGLETLTIPEGVKFIGNEAFAHHATLRQVTLPSSMEEIGFFAFQTASALEEVTLNEGLDRIGQYAFHNCRSLQSVHLPASLKQILSGAFYETPLQTITVDAQNEVFSMQNGMLLGEGIVYKFALSTQGEQITVPAGVTEIDQGAFEGAGFQGVSLPSSLQTIGQTAFSNCENLLHVTIPENVSRIGDMAFSGCDMLLSAVIPANVVRFGDSLFHLGMTEYYVTVFGEEGSQAQAYCEENEIEFKLLSTFPCANGHNVQKKEDNSNIYSYVWWWECEACGCKTHTFTKLYTSMGDPEITYALESETHIYDETKFTPDVLWVKFKNTLLTENVDYQVEYGENLVHSGNNFIRLKGIGEFRGERFIPLTIERAPITNAVAVLDCYEFEYDGNSKYPAVRTLTLNGKELNRDTDFGTTFEDNVQVGIGYVVIRGGGNYTGELRVPFTITEHQHKWGSWNSVDELQHQRKCTVSICEYYTAPQRADHRYDDEHDGICNDCGYTRDVRISIADAVAVLDCYEYTYDGDPKQPWVQTLTLNGKELTRFADFVTAFENNTEIGTGYVIIRGNGNYTGELRVPFAIVAHQHDWTDWTSSDSTQHYRFCKDTFCDEYGDEVYQPHCYDDIHDEVCNDCGYTRTDAHSFTDRYQSDEQTHWLVCDGCDKTQGATYPHSGGTATCQVLAVCSDCGRSYGTLGECDWTWMMDEQYHWEQCTVCGDTTAKVEHSGGTPTCTTQGNCGICGKAYGDLAEHQYHKTGDEVNHWEQCFYCPATQNVGAHSGPAPTTCGMQAICVDCTMPFGEPAGHSGGTATCTAPAFCQYCSAPYGTVAPHQWVQQAGVTHHWMKCKNCDATQGRVAHSGGTATCKEQAKCTACQKAYGDLKSHQWTNACDAECNVCKTTRTPAAHTGGTATCKERAKCSVCGVAYGNLAAHKFGGYVYNNDATSQKDGTQTRTCTLCGLKQTTAAAGTKIKNPFKDVKASEYYTEPVLWAVGKSITNGMSADTFAPNNECTRGQIVTFLWRAAGSPKPKSTKNPFRDVQKGAYYYDAVLWAVEKGITTGTSANTFSPDAACTRGQVVTFLHRAKGKPAASGKNAFADVKSGTYYYDAVRWAVGKKITNGMSATSFAPDATCTRGQIVTFLYRAYN